MLLSQQGPHGHSVLAGLWRACDLPAEALNRISLPGSEPVLPSSYALGTALSCAVAASALAAVEIGRTRGGAAQSVSVDLGDVARESACRFTVDGQMPPMWDKLSGFYPCGGVGGAEPGHVRIHANFAHHRDGALVLLGLAPGPGIERAAVAEALRTWSAAAFETAAAERGLVVAALRTPEQWASHPQAAAVAALPLVAIERIGDAPPRPLPPIDLNAPPLQGLRVLDLTRILAGPVAGRTLAAHGADVLLVNSPKLPNIEALAETSRGKLSAHLDLSTGAGREALRGLVREGDIFLQGYRPGGLAKLGFGPQELARHAPGIVCVSLSAYGHCGPWRDRKGFDSLVQTATGFNVAEAEAFGSAQPRAFPVQALDYAAGFLLAFGALAAKWHQAREGGTWLVRVSLCGVGHWLQSLGRLPEGLAAQALSFEGVMETADSGFGRLSAVRHCVRMSHSQVGYARLSMPPGSHPPAWPPR